MSSSAITNEMLSYFNRLDESQQKTFLQILKTFFQNHKEDVLAQSVEDYTKELEERDREIESGDFILHEDVLKYFSIQ